MGEQHRGAAWGSSMGEQHGGAADAGALEPSAQHWCLHGEARVDDRRGPGGVQHVAVVHLHRRARVGHKGGNAVLEVVKSTPAWPVIIMPFLGESANRIRTYVYQNRTGIWRGGCGQKPRQCTHVRMSAFLYIRV